jgi:hypothetical protein
VVEQALVRSTDLVSLSSTLPADKKHE